MGIMISIMATFLAWSTETGSRSLLYAALANDSDKMRGQFINPFRVDEPSDFVLSENGKIAQDRLWVSTLCICSYLLLTVSERDD
jgi:hypothetical protein